MLQALGKRQNTRVSQDWWCSYDCVPRQVIEVTGFIAVVLVCNPGAGESFIYLGASRYFLTPAFPECIFCWSVSLP
jgi:hypothetical protein